MEGKVPLSINIPVSTKQQLLELARKEDTTMTNLIIRWVEEHSSK